MLFTQIKCGGDRNYGYVVTCKHTNLTAVIDPSPDPLDAFNFCFLRRLRVKYIINTHTHSDHTGGNGIFRVKMGAKLVTHHSATIGDIRVGDNDTLTLGDLTLKFIHTPGHTPESMCILAGKNLATGDTLFVGKVGGTSSRQDGETEFVSLQKLMQLEPDTIVWPGHNYGVRPSSTIGEEKTSNPFLLRLNNIEDFFWLKDNWAAYKKEHHIA